MSNASVRARFKTPRLITEELHKEIDSIRKRLMVATADEDNVAAQDTLNEVRMLVDDLAHHASRPSIDDVRQMSPGDYVTTMKPLVARYHRQLHELDLLAPAICEDLQVLGCVIIMVGEDKTTVRTAHHPERPDVALAVDTIVQAIDVGTKAITEAAQQVAEAAGPEGITDVPPPEEPA